MKFFILLLLALVLIAQVFAQEEFENISEVGESEGIPSFLLEAAGRGDVEGIRQALDKGESILTTNVNGWSPVMFAAGSGSVEAVRYLHDNGADVNLANKDGVTPLMLATAQGNKDLVEYLLQAGANPSYIANDHSTAQQIANSSGRKLLSIVIAEANLLYSISNGRQDEIISESLRNGAFADLTTGSGWTALIYAASRGNNELVNDLLDHNADINRFENDRWTPLHFAAHNGHEQVVRTLLSRGADVSITNIHGQTARQLAEVANHTNIVAMIPEYSQEL